MRNLRLQGETHAAFQARATRAARIARVLVDSCLANQCVKDLIADPELPFYTEAGFKQDPIVRVDFEEAICIASIGEGLAATQKKNWGDGPNILPLEETDPVDPMFVLYMFKSTSKYNRRFEQRQRMKELLGRYYRPLVQRAKYHRNTKAMFLDSLSDDEAALIRRVFKVEPGIFWRAARGKVFLDLPKRMLQLELFES